MDGTSHQLKQKKKTNNSNIESVVKCKSVK